MKNVQISEELFVRLCGYHLLGKQDQLQKQIICDMLQDKLDRIQAREEYSKNNHSIGSDKTAP